METSSYNFTDSQKESCAVTAMRDAVISLSAREDIPVSYTHLTLPTTIGV